MNRTLHELMDLSDRVALITGGAGHIGRAIGEGLAELGAKIVILDQHEVHCTRAADDLNAAWPHCASTQPCDLSKEAALRRSIRKTVATFGRLDIAIHCAGFVGTTQMAGWVEPLNRQTVQAWDAAVRVNMTAAFILGQETMKPLARSGHGSLIFISSIYGISGPDMRLYKGTSMGNPAAYGASKAGLLQLTRHFATTLAPKVRCNAITPGGVLRGQPNSFQRQYKKRTPMGRMATEEDIKGAAAYLASDASAYVTGQNLVVDGGWTAW